MKSFINYIDTLIGKKKKAHTLIKYRHILLKVMAMKLIGAAFYISYHQCPRILFSHIYAPPTGDQA